MYKIYIPIGKEIAYIASGKDGDVVLPQSEREIMLIHMLQGTAQIHYQELTQTAYAGDIVAIARDTGVSFSGDSSFHWLLCAQVGLFLSPVTSRSEPSDGAFILCTVFPCTQPTQLQYLFNDLVSTQDDTPFAECKQAYLTGLIICEASRQYFYPGSSKHHLRFLEILNWLQTHYAEKLSLDDISVRFQYNKVYLCRLFKNKTGETMYSFITRLRMERAMALLLETTDTVKEIAREVGYADEKQFIRNFRQTTKMTTTQYRMQSVRGGYTDKAVSTD